MLPTNAQPIRSALPIISAASMSTPLLITLAFGALLAAWAALTLMGGERARRRAELQMKRTKPGGPPVLSVSEAPAGIAQSAPHLKSKHAKPQVAGARKNSR